MVGAEGIEPTTPAV